VPERRPVGPGAPFTIGRLPRIAFGPGSATGAGAAVAGHGRHVLLLTGRSFRAGSGWRALLDALADAGLRVTPDLVPPGEPTPASVDALVGRHRDADLDVLLGVGGGSVLDTTKAVAGLLRSGTAAVDHLEGLPGQRPYPGPALPWVAVPTTAGTGSEATRNAVLTVGGSAPAKRSFRDERLVAAEAIVDPDLLVGLPATTIAANGADALTQLLESYLSSRANAFTDALAVDGLRVAGRALPRWHGAVARGGDDADARSGMAYAALVSGICLAHTGLGVVHGLVAPLGAHTATPHGAGCGALLVAGVRANIEALERTGGEQALRRYSELGRLLAGAPGEASDAHARGTLVAWLRSLVADLGVPGLAHWGLTPGIAATVASLARTSSSMRTNPVELSEGELVDVLLASR